MLALLYPPKKTMDAKQALQRLKHLRKQVTDNGVAASATKQEASKIEHDAIQFLLSMKKRYYDESENSGTGPFWCLCKVPSEGSLSKQRQHDWYQQLLETIYSRAPATISIAEVIQMHNAYMKQFEKRSLALKCNSYRPHREGVEDLLRWLEGKDE